MKPGQQVIHKGVEVMQKNSDRDGSAKFVIGLSLAGAAVQIEQQRSIFFFRANRNKLWHTV